MYRWISWVFSTCLVAMFIGACGSFEVGIEHVPPDSADEVDWQATAEALQTEATRAAANLQTPLSILPTQPAPTLVPMATAPAQQEAAVAYVQGGDIWVKSLPDGEALRLTHDGRNRLPRWSASGEWLTFLKDSEGSQLWLVRRDGSDAGQIGNQIGESHAWSPVDDTLAFGETGGVNLLMPESGMQSVLPTQQVEPGTIRRLGKIAWSPDGQQLAYTETVRQLNDDVLQDGLWVADIDPSMPVQIVEGNLPEEGEIILHSWSGDGNYVLYWQAPVRSASLLADGVPLYRVSIAGGTPQQIAEAVLPHEDAVQSQPNGLPQVAFVEGSGREMWHNKRLHSVIVSGMQEWELTPPDQAASSPVWSPAGDAIAYIGAPDVEGVGGGPEAQAALNLRQLWIVEGGNGEPRPVKQEIRYREEAPQWIDDETLLVARLDFEGRVSLWQVSRNGDNEQEVVDEITPAPEWFGYYGYIRWQEHFSLWRPRTVAQEAITLELTPTVVPPHPMTGGERRLVDFLVGLHLDLTRARATELWGSPDIVTGSDLVIYEYWLEDGMVLHFGFPGEAPLTYAQLSTEDGRVFAITPLEELLMPEAAATATPTPASMDAATATPVPARNALPTPTPFETPTATPILVEEETATPLPTAPMPETATPVPGP